MGPLCHNLEKVWPPGMPAQSTLPAKRTWLCGLLASFCKICSLKANRGSIACRRDPVDKQEWQFALRKTVVWSEEEVKHGFHGESAAKAEATQWLKLKAQGLLEDEGEGRELAASRALEDVLPREGLVQAMWVP